MLRDDHLQEFFSSVFNFSRVWIYMGKAKKADSWMFNSFDDLFVESCPRQNEDLIVLPTVFFDHFLDEIRLSGSLTSGDED